MSPARVALLLLPLLIVAAAAAQDGHAEQRTDVLQVRPMSIPTDIATRFNALRAMDTNQPEVSHPFEVNSAKTRRFDLDQVYVRNLTEEQPDGAEIVVEAGRIIEAGCYTMRSYRYARPEKGSDVTVPVGYTTCTPVKKFELKSADVHSR